eukprot:TRINITY_DN7856_c0_g1_i1.p1 TRINITY_DN7856_c0_g1~~TRINITY_DN7856_c0_g1_i1.p1  ORF type:complete len:304 (-),score=66.33 TRINITY_DN7856_c0_g1_i1:113-979(-)
MAAVPVPKLAASILVLAPSKPSSVSSLKEGSQFKVLMVKRSEKSRFMPGYHVFPGGIAETADQDPRWSSLLKLKEMEKESNFLRISALRELFEETNVLLTSPSPSQSVDEWRQKTQKNAEAFLEMCSSLSLIPNVESTLPWSHWITPKQEKWRYDTYFFVSPLQEEKNLVLGTDGRETTEIEWVTPTNAVRDFQGGKMFLAPPTWIMLTELATHKTIDDVIAAAKAGRNMKPVMPHIVHEDGKTNICFEADFLHPSSPPPNKGKQVRHRIVIADGSFSYENNLNLSLL